MARIDGTNCCGCGLCHEVCPTHAISMVADEYGFLTPHIDDAACVNCGKCADVCVMRSREEGIAVETALLAAHRDREILNASSSGGAYTAICQAIAAARKDKVIVWYGAAWQEDYTVRHERSETLDGISRFRKSKYTQSEVYTQLASVKKDLQEGRVVVFAGTPCQVAAVKRHVGKFDDNLYTIDLVCNGVGSPRSFKSYVKAKWGKPSAVDMRYKKSYHGDVLSKWLAVKKGKKLHTERMNYYMSLYYAGEFNREDCFACPYAAKERISDFTIGDIHKVYPCLTEPLYKEGVSVLLLNTPRAQALKEIFAEKMMLTEIPYEEVYNHSKRLQEAGQKPKHYPALMERVIACEKNPDKAILEMVPLFPLWKQRLGEVTPAFLWKLLKK